MVSSAAKTVGEYLKGLPPERRRTVAAVRKLIRDNLPKGYRETMRYGMIGYEIPLAEYPDTYNGQPLVYVALAAQKSACSLYLNCVFVDESRNQRLRDAFARAGKKLDMGKSCIRFKSVEDLESSAIAAEIARTSPARFIEQYEKSRR